MSKKLPRKVNSLKFVSNEKQKMDTSEVNRKVTRSQTVSATNKKSKYRRSSSHNDLGLVDLTVCDDDTVDIPLKKPKTSASLAQKEFIDIKKGLVPKTSADLVINANKIQEVKEWFEECDRLKKIRPNSILLVTGPCGSGKLTCVKVIAEESGYDVYEYVSPLDYDLNDMKDQDRDWEYTSKQSQAESLTKFLRETTRYGTIFKTSKSKKLIICKDIPNIFSEKPELFRDILKQFSQWGRAPLVFITNDAKGKGMNLNYKLFNDDNLATFKIAQITLNPVSYMQISKHLKFVAAKMIEKQFQELYNSPSSETIDSIIVSSQGDLRNATINLLFACQKGAIKMGNQKEASKLTVKKQAKKYKNLGTDENVTLMHLFGKVFNPKYEQKEGIQTLTNNPEALTDMFSSQANTCLKMLFVNYAPHFMKIDDAAATADLLSTTDVLMSDWRDDILSFYGLNIGIRGAMVLNSEPAKSFKGAIRGYKKIFSKSDTKPTKSSIGAKSMHDTFQMSRSRTCEDLPSSVYTCDYVTYGKIIKSDPNASLLNIEEAFEDDIYDIDENFDDDPE